VEVAALVVGPERLPQPQYIRPLEFALVPDKQHPEEKEEVCRLSGLKVKIQLGVHKLYEVVKRRELLAHAGLVA